MKITPTITPRTRKPTVDHGKVAPALISLDMTKENKVESGRMVKNRVSRKVLTRSGLTVSSGLGNHIINHLPTRFPQEGANISIEINNPDIKS